MTTREPDRTQYAEPTARSFLTWTPSLLRAAEIQAEMGNLRLAADLFESMLGDERIKGVFDTRAQSLFGLDLDFEAGQGRKKRQAMKAIEAEEDFDAAYPESELTRILTWANGLGVAVAEQVWTDRSAIGGFDPDTYKGTERVIPLLRWKHPRNLRWDWRSHTWFLRVELLDERGATLYQEIPITPGDGKWMIFTPYGVTRPWSAGLWRGMSRWFLIKQFALMDLGRFSQNATGVQVGTSPEGSSQDDRTKLLNDMLGLASNGKIVLPPGYDLKMVALTNAPKEIYQMQVEMADTGNTIAVLGANLPTQAGSGGSSGGSHAASKTQEATTLGRTRNDGKSVASWLHDQSLVHWAEYNFGDRQLAPWPLWRTEPPEDTAGQADALDKMADALTKLDAIGVDIDPILEDWNLERISEEKMAEREANKPPAPPPPNGNPPDPNAPPQPPNGQQPPQPPPAKGAEAPKEGDPIGADEPVPEGFVKIAGHLRKKPAGKDQAKTTIRLRSGTPIGKRRGFVRGQVYADHVALEASGAAASAMSDDVRAVLKAIEDGTSYDDIRKKIQAAYRKMDPANLAEDVVQPAITMANMAGRASVAEDTSSRKARTDAKDGDEQPNSPSPVVVDPDPTHTAANGVYQQLRDDYPAAALTWIKSTDMVKWSGPTAIPLDMIDMSERDTWTASKHPERVEAFAEKIEKGELKPIILVKKPGKDQMEAIDGHHRLLAYEALGRPPVAYIGYTSKAKGPWDELHASQIREDSIVPQGKD